MYDVEGMNNTYYMENGQPKFYDPAPTVLEWETLIRQYRSTVQAILKKRLLLYTDKGEWDSFGLQNFTDVTGDDLWIAQITENAPTIPAPFSSWKLHQYSWNGKVPGITGAVDRSRFNGSQSDFDSWAGTGGGWSLSKALGVSALGVAGVLGLKALRK
jgi:GH25 family lysozyme M1 (1,4-beta-N-acetylmuramidase)